MCDYGELVQRVGVARQNSDYCQSKTRSSGRVADCECEEYRAVTIGATQRA
ncbi:hypothetical protein LINPERHAP1_LOCUS3367 [Linum perenne]